MDTGSRLIVECVKRLRRRQVVWIPSRGCQVGQLPEANRGISGNGSIKRITNAFSAWRPVGLKVPVRPFAEDPKKAGMNRHDDICICLEELLQLCDVAENPRQRRDHRHGIHLIVVVYELHDHLGATDAMHIGGAVQFVDERLIEGIGVRQQLAKEVNAIAVVSGTAGLLLVTRVNGIVGAVSGAIISVLNERFPRNQTQIGMVGPFHEAPLWIRKLVESARESGSDRKRVCTERRRRDRRSPTPVVGYPIKSADTVAMRRVWTEARVLERR